MNILLRTDCERRRQIVENAMPQQSLNLYCAKSDPAMAELLQANYMNVVFIDVSPKDPKGSILRLKSIKMLRPNANLVCLCHEVQFPESPFATRCLESGAMRFLDSTTTTKESFKIALGRIIAEALTLAVC
jgi:DNA-binding NtrC family response regulator